MGGPVEDTLALQKVPETPITETKLSAKEEALAQRLANQVEIDSLIHDSTAISDFGLAEAESLSKTTKPLLDMVRTGNAGEFGKSLTNVVMLVQNSKPAKPRDGKSSGPSFLSRIGIGAIRDEVKQRIIETEKVEANLKMLEAVNAQDERTLRANVVTMDDLQRQNMINLQLYAVRVRAAEILLEKMKSRADELQASAVKEPANTQLAQSVYAATQAVRRMGNRLNVLRQLKTATLQSVPTIFIVRNNFLDQLDINKATLIGLLTIWQIQATVGIALEEQRKISARNKAIADALGDMMVSNAQLLDQNTDDVREQGTRGIMDNDKAVEAAALTVGIVNKHFQSIRERDSRLEAEKAKLEGVNQALIAAMSQTV